MSLQRRINKLAPHNDYIVRSAKRRVEKDQRREMTGFPVRPQGKSLLSGRRGVVTIDDGFTVQDRNPPLKADKGKENGSCNRTACQRPLAHELEHQFMDGNFTGKGRLFYCQHCARDFDQWDHQSGDRVRIKREPKFCEACGDSKIEEVYVGHGAIAEVPCSVCAEPDQ